MPLLLLPLLVLVLVLLWLLLLPLALWQRYRMGRMRRRAVAWAVGFNAWSLLLSLPLFLAGAWLAGHWMDAALGHACAGVAAGLVLGVIGLRLTRFEPASRGLYYTPNAWLVLAITLLVAARLVWSLYRMQQAWFAEAPVQWLSQQGSVLGLGGLLIGYYLAYVWGLRRRLRGS